MVGRWHSRRRDGLARSTRLKVVLLKTRVYRRSLENVRGLSDDTFGHDRSVFQSKARRGTRRQSSFSIVTRGLRHQSPTTFSNFSSRKRGRLARVHAAKPAPRTTGTVCVSLFPRNSVVSSPIWTIESSIDSRGPWLSRTQSILFTRHRLDHSQKPTRMTGAGGVEDPAAGRRVVGVRLFVGRDAQLQRVRRRVADLGVAPVRRVARRSTKETDKSEREREKAYPGTSFAPQNTRRERGKATAHDKAPLSSKPLSLSKRLAKEPLCVSLSLSLDSET